MISKLFDGGNGQIYTLNNYLYYSNLPRQVQGVLKMLQQVLSILAFILLQTHNCLSQYNWVQVTSSSPELNFTNITARNDDTLFAACTEDTSQFIVKSGDHGKTWITVGTHTSKYGSFISAYENKLFLSAITTSVSNDGGKSWEPVNVGNPSYVACGPITSLSNGDLYMASTNLAFSSEEKFIYKSTDGGATWSSIKIQGIPAKAKFMKAIASSNGNICITCYSWDTPESGLYCSTDSGRTFSKAFIPWGGSGFFRNTGFAAGNSGDLFLFGTHDTSMVLFNSKDNGATWSSAGFSGITNFTTTGVVVKSKNRFLVAGTQANDGQVKKVYESIDITSLQKIPGPQSIKMWPSPGNGFVNITSPEGLIIYSVDIFNAAGKKILSRNVQSADACFSGLNPGVFFVKVYLPENQTFTQRIIVH